MQLPIQTDEFGAICYPVIQVRQLEPSTQVAQPNIHEVHCDLKKIND